MKVMLCEINTTPGNFAGNVERIKDCIYQGYENDADLIVFPELSIPGYLCKDMMFQQGFVEKNLLELHGVAAFCDTLALADSNKPLTVVVGYIDANRSGSGKPFRNMAAVIQDGVVKATYAKHLLPFYDVFDEGRYFEPGTELSVVEICGEKWGIIICEDGWNDKGMDNYNYHDCPLERYRELGIKNIISINSSPYVVDKISTRKSMINQSTSSGGTIIYVNQYGGQDELFFDGNSMISVDGGMVHKNQTRNEYFELTKATLLAPKVLNEYGYKYKEIYEALIGGLRDYVYKSGFEEAVICSSGGIDSAVVIALACEALGPENVNAISIPTKNNKPASLNDARQLHKNLGCNHFEIELNYENLLATINNSFAQKSTDAGYNKVADENIQARLRGLINMHFSNSRGVLPLTTGNKTELALGYCTLYGDMTGGFAPISDLYKMEVYELAKYINKKGNLIPDNIILKEPSAELAPDQTDEASLMPYPILDEIVRLYIENYIGNYRKFYERVKDIACLYSFLPPQVDEENFINQYNRMIKLVDRSEFKRRQSAPGIKIHKVAFGSGRRLPIVKG